jgi:hypothetical protein
MSSFIFSSPFSPFEVKTCQITGKRFWRGIGTTMVQILFCLPLAFG